METPNTSALQPSQPTRPIATPIPHEHHSGESCELENTSSHSHSNSTYSSLLSRDERDFTRTQSLLHRRRQLTEALSESPYDLVLYLERANCHTDLGYPDLGVGDAYRALLLVDEVREEGWEYHDVALDALRARLEDGDWAAELFPEQGGERTGGEKPNTESGEESEEQSKVLIDDVLVEASIRSYQIISLSLLLCGCLKTAYEFCSRGLALSSSSQRLLHTREYIQNLARQRLNLPPDTTDFDITQFPDKGLVRREIYPWNTHEPDRFTPESLDLLNAELRTVAPKCEVRATELPTLVEFAATIEGGQTNKQLGLFAKEDIFAGEVVLDEFSLLTANNRLRASLCDACSSPLPALDVAESERAIACPGCEDTLFCSRFCCDAAMASYHPAVCGKDVDAIAKDPEAAETPNALYLLLLARAFAMSATQDTHPLLLTPVRFIWGDFLPTSKNEVPLSPTAGPPPVWTLPFSFSNNVSGPLHILEKMDLDIFASLQTFDTWIINTLYAKFRGTASARVGRDDGRPEVAAVHPLWCLANHDCAPNVGWEWGGRMRFVARDFPGAPLDWGRVGDRDGAEVVVGGGEGEGEGEGGVVQSQSQTQSQSQILSVSVIFRDDETTPTPSNPRGGGHGSSHAHDTSSSAGGGGSESGNGAKEMKAKKEKKKEKKTAAPHTGNGTAKRVVIPAGREILSHYCDIDLPVKERREWARGSLGGWCVCERCRRESAEEGSAAAAAAGVGRVDSSGSGSGSGSGGSSGGGGVRLSIISSEESGEGEGGRLQN